jgi:hypothetical protein
MFYLFKDGFIVKERKPPMGSTISRSFFLPIYWLIKKGDLQLELRSSNPSQGAKIFTTKSTILILQNSFHSLGFIALVS